MAGSEEAEREEWQLTDVFQPNSWQDESFLGFASSKVVGSICT